ncbi:MAG: hypothetical protein PF572_03290 [Patescibacteria group bacterium]|jgi:hypothetical protein|nr:hypothetical protein [Patescibacteria group bacterium]
MEDFLFKKEVIKILGEIKDFLSNPDKGSVELRKTISKLEKNNEWLEVQNKKLTFDLKNSKKENDELYADLIAMEEDVKPTSCVSDSQFEKASCLIEQSNDSLADNNSASDENFQLSDEQNSDEWELPKALLENREFSLKKLQKENVGEDKMINNFVLLIFLIAHFMNEDDSDGFNKCLDLGLGVSNKDLRDSAYKKLKSLKKNCDHIEALYEELLKIPQKNRYQNLIKKFKELIV